MYIYSWTLTQMHILSQEQVLVRKEDNFHFYSLRTSQSFILFCNSYPSSGRNLEISRHCLHIISTHCIPGDCTLLFSRNILKKTRMKRRLEIKTEIQAPFGILALLFLELKSQKHLKKKQVSEKKHRHFIQKHLLQCIYQVLCWH